MFPHNYRLVFLLIAVITLECNPRPRPEQEAERSIPMRSLKEVQESHTEEFMSIAGVVGTAIGENEDGTPSILVLVEEQTGEIKAKIPPVLEGYPVRIQVTGKIAPIR